jgi:hypothetical protein
VSGGMPAHTPKSGVYPRSFLKIIHVYEQDRECA